MEFLFSSEEEAQKACWWWQKQIIGLSDWTIVVRIKRIVNMCKQRQASADLCWESRQAEIDLMDPIDCLAQIPMDHEWNLVHELGHCMIQPFMANVEDKMMYSLHERHLEELSQTLVNLRRKAYPEPPWRKEQST